MSIEISFPRARDGHKTPFLNTEHPKMDLGTGVEADGNSSPQPELCAGNLSQTQTAARFSMHCSCICLMDAQEVI